MVRTVGISEFIDDMASKGYTSDEAEAFFDYLTELEDQQGEQLEYDLIAFLQDIRICSSEDDVIDYAEEYSEFRPDEDEDEDKFELALEFLRDHNGIAWEDSSTGVYIFYAR